MIVTIEVVMTINLKNNNNNNNNIKINDHDRSTTRSMADSNLKFIFSLIIQCNMNSSKHFLGVIATPKWVSYFTFLSRKISKVL